MKESELIVRARQRDEAAWERLTLDHQQAVFRFAYLLLGDADEAGDAAQDAFIRAYYALDRFDASRPLRPWLMSIAANVARNRRRAVSRYLAALERLIRAEPQWAAAPAPDSGRGESDNLWRAVRQLGEADQEIIYLRYFLEMTEAEAAQALGVALGTVKSRTHRALSRLRAVVETDYPELRELVLE